VKPFVQAVYGGTAGGKAHPAGTGNGASDVISGQSSSAWEGRAIATHKLCLVEFSAFMEQQNPDTVCCSQFI
jgi:transcriptional enhancer factor